MSYNPNSTGSKLGLTGSTSGTVSQFAAAATASYSIVWPAAQAAGPGYVLGNDGAGNLSWVVPGEYNAYPYTLNSTDIANQYITLPQAPATPGDTILNIIGGPAQSYGSDFSVTGSQLNFLGDLSTGGNAALISGDTLIIQFN